MQTGNRFRAYPTPAQEQILLRWIGHQRFVYNAKVSEDRYYRVFSKKAVSLSGTPVPVDQAIVQEWARFIGENTSWLRMFSEKELEPRTMGFDRGVATPVTASDGRSMDLLPVHKFRIEKKERSRRRWQRKLARQQKGSSNRRKTRTRLAWSFEYTKEVRKDVVHKATHALASDPDRSLFVVEDLKVRNMTKKPEPRQDDSGRYVRNGSRAKAGLNKAILSSGWGLLVTFLTYKARRSGKLVIKVPLTTVLRNVPDAGMFIRTTGPPRPSSSASAASTPTMPIKTPAMSLPEGESVSFWKERSGRKRFGDEGSENRNN